MATTTIFVYGTLIRGYLNYDKYLGRAIALGKAEFVGKGVTSVPDWCLVLRKARKVPCLFHASTAESGYRVPGEVFRVDADTLRALDVLEGVDEAGYYREEIDVDVETADGTQKVIKAHVYLKVITPELTLLEPVPAYTDEHHEFYKSRQSTPNLSILQWIYGKTATDQVRELLDAGVAFDVAWKQAVGEDWSM